MQEEEESDEGEAEAERQDGAKHDHPRRSDRDDGRRVAVQFEETEEQTGNMLYIWQSVAREIQMLATVTYFENVGIVTLGCDLNQDLIKYLKH